MKEDPFTPDEREAQRRAGFTSGGAAIRPFMPDQHREFFTLLPYLFAATADADGWPIATMMTGEAGFVHSPTPTTLRIATLPAAGDPSQPNIGPGRRIGMLGLDLSTRRRNRANGIIRETTEGGMLIDVKESFGNCPHYIQRRTVTKVDRQAGASDTFNVLPSAVAHLIDRSDTFFIATAARADIGKGGLDVSHRGGKPGFVRIVGNRLSIPDFRGNRYYNTLGNVLGEPRVGLLFVDYETGDVAHVQGRATIDWTSDGKAMAGAERVWHVDIEHGWWRPGAVGLTWRYQDAAALTMATGTWADHPA